MIRGFKPAITRFAYLIALLAFALAHGDVAGAAQIARAQSLSNQTAIAPNALRFSQSINRYGTILQTTPTGPTGGKYPGTSGGSNTGSKNPGGSRQPSGRPGATIGIDALGIINNPGIKTPPRRTPPRTIYRPPITKKVYVPPRKTPATTARRPQPRRPVRTAIVQPIPQFIADQVTVLLQNQPDAVDNELAQAFGLAVIASNPITLLEGRLVTFRVLQGRPLPQVIAALSVDTRVTIAQPNNIYLTVGQRSRRAPASAQYALAKLRLGSAHQIAQGRGVPVAVIDTGVDVSHPVLAKSVGQSFDAVADGKGDVDDHGTAIAGLIAGKGKVTGVAPAASLFAVRSFYMHPQYKRPVTSTDVLLRAFDWAFTNGARIFNMSFSGPFDPLVQAALTSAHDKGLILVAAAGNGGPKAPPAYPAAYKNVIAITALDQKDRLYAHANRGGYLAAAAPGVNVLVPSLKKGYKFSSGTSMAAAHVSGLIALLLEKNPEATSADVLKAIQTTAHDLGPKGHDIQFGAGRADAHASLMSLPAGEVKLTSGQ